LLQRLFTSVLFMAALAAPAISQQAPAERTRQPADPLDGPPLVTAKAWVIGDGRSGCRLWGGGDSTGRAIASTTKIMTAWLVVQLIEQDQAILEEVVTFSERADKTGGSTSAIRAGEQLPVKDLLYGLLLPSGNDAATALAEHFGRRFALEDKEDKEAETSDDDSRAAFIAEMNRTARTLQMKETEYIDPHGLGANRSSACDLLRLTHTAMQSETFRRYVQTQEHRCKLTAADGSTREASWKNTNQALNIEGFDGVKTGTTNAAGACLVASCRRGDDHLLVVVLGSTSPDARYIDARNLLRWAWTQRAR
jgi:D-alanyl-D-alanine carboxypeptidase (penicillin-binding protein 5/6)